MQSKYDALVKNNMWTPIDLPPGASLVGYKWVFRNKFNEDGTFQHHKAWVVAKGFHHIAGFHYTETFNPIIKPTTVRIVLFHAISSKWPIHQIDINALW